MKPHKYDVIFLLITGFVFTIIGIITAVLTPLWMIPLIFTIFIYYLVAWLESK